MPVQTKTEIEEKLLENAMRAQKVREAAEKEKVKGGGVDAETITAPGGGDLTTRSPFRQT